MSDAHQGTGASAAAANRTTGKGERKVGPGGGRKGPRKPSRARQKRLSRERAVQALYQWDLSAGQASSIRQEILDTQEFSKADVGFFELLFNGVSHDPDSVDAELQRALDRPIAELDPIERAVLRLAAYELATQLDTPARVIINEGVEITRRFGADNGHRYVNGVLDKLARYLRPLEMKPR
ncbi:MAG: transcription antitermination factor NusB [Gammaproteobacteria bacterium]|nr:MAG: transcription antitermination factor NusB [Gammaproteobacteria bacterium]